MIVTDYKHQRYVAIFSIFLIASCLCFSFLFEQSYSSYYALQVGGLCCLLVLLFNTTPVKEFTTIDSVLVVYAIYLLLCSLVYGASTLTPKYMVLLCVVPVYFWSKNQCKTSLFWAIIISGGFQLVVALLQLAGVVSNNNADFAVGGTLGNPNVLSFYLLISFYTAVYLRKQGNASKSLLIYMALCLFFIAWLKCRTVWLILMVNTAIYFCQIAGAMKGGNSQTIKRNLAYLFGILMLPACIGLYAFKPASAQSRQFIWQNTIDLIKDNPISGYGPDRFFSVFNLVQEDFFTNQPDSKFANVVGEPMWAYNEYLEHWLEIGVIGILLFTILTLFPLINLWTRKGKLCFSNRGFYQPVFIAFAIYSALNFTITAYPILLLFIIISAQYSRQIKTLLYVPDKVLKMLLYPLAVFLVYALSVSTEVLIINKQVHQHLEGTETNNDIIVNAANEYPEWHRLQLIYATSLEDQRQAQSQLVCLHHDYPAYEVKLALAGSFLNTSDISIAHKWLQKAHNQIPKRVEPLCMQFLSMPDDYDTECKKGLAIQLVNMNLSDDSEIQLQAKTQAYEYLQDN